MHGQSGLQHRAEQRCSSLEVTGASPGRDTCRVRLALPLTPQPLWFSAAFAARAALGLQGELWGW